MNKKNLILPIICGIVFINNTFADNLTNNTNNLVKIQNGSIVKDPELNARFPLLYNSASNTTCTATLIDLPKKKILTAAHCVIKQLREKKSGELLTTNDLVRPEDLKVIFSKNLDNPVDIGLNPVTSNVYTVTSIYMHKDAFKGAYIENNSGKLKFGIAQGGDDDLNDLAILELKENLSNIYKSVTVASSTLRQGSSVEIAGYGQANVPHPDPSTTTMLQSGVLRSAKSTVQDLSRLSTYYAIGGINNGLYTRICPGDSGGPDFTRNNNEIILHGVHSLGRNGKPCGQANTPGMSVNVAHYTSWITNTYKDDSLSLRALSETFQLDNVSLSNNYSKKVMDVQYGGNLVNNQPVIQYQMSSGAKNQLWDIVPLNQNEAIGDPLFKIKVHGTDFALTENGEQKLVIQQYSEKNMQNKWKIYKTIDGTYLIQSANDKKYVDLLSCDEKNDISLAVKSQPSCPYGSSQKWLFSNPELIKEEHKNRRYEYSSMSDNYIDSILFNLSQGTEKIIKGYTVKISDKEEKYLDGYDYQNGAIKLNLLKYNEGRGVHFRTEKVIVWAVLFNNERINIMEMYLPNKDEL